MNDRTVFEAMGLDPNAPPSLVAEFLVEAYPNAEMEIVEAWSMAKRRQAVAWAARNALSSMGGGTPTPPPSWLHDALTAPTPVAHGPAQAAAPAPAKRQRRPRKPVETFDLDTLPEGEPDTHPQPDPDPTLRPESFPIDFKPDVLNAVVDAPKSVTRAPAKPGESPPEGWVDVPQNRYGTPEVVRDLLAMLWPAGIDRDPFHDPKSGISAREYYSIRRGQDALKLDWFAESGNAFTPSCQRVYANGPFVVKGNPGMGPTDWAPKGVADWLMAGPMWAELVMCLPVYPGTPYWRNWIWPHASVAWAGRVSYDIDGAPNKSGNRYESCFTYMGPPPMHDRFVALARAQGWAATRAAG